MPDRRTVYMTDDGTNTGLWKFIADRKNDVSSGECSHSSRCTQLVGWQGEDLAKLAAVHVVRRC